MEKYKRTQVYAVTSYSLLLLPVLFVLSALGALADGNITLESITIFDTHEWFKAKPTVYFRCKDEKKVYLPDVAKKNIEYTFMGQESWQPLTELQEEKCKRCGLYEEDSVKPDDTFGEWELCPSDFSSADGRHVYFQKKEFNATFLCYLCKTPQGSGSTADDENEKDIDTGITLVIVAFVLLVIGGVGAIAYSKWRQKQREEQQARFVKLFEDDDDLEAELGLKDRL